ncbi:MAG: IS1634 family transposase, partial [Steroidobacteraceae bacterium]
MYVAYVPNRRSPPAYLLREGRREDGKVKTRTLANLSHWPLAKIERLRRVLRDEVLPDAKDGLSMLRSLPHGHVAAVLGTARKLGLDRLLAAGRAPPRLVALVLAMIVARVIDPASKLATARQLDATTAAASLGALLGLGAVDEQELYAALDWLLAQQARIEQRLARRHLRQGTLVLYDVSSTYFEGRTCPLARYGYSRDGKRDKLQIVFGLLCASDGCPVAVEVFEGNVADPATLTSQVEKLRQRFHLAHVVLVGDRGMITEARIETLLRPAGLDWITALRAPSIRALLEQGAFQLSLFDERDLAEVTSPEFPGERLVVCRNPLLAAERARKRGELLAATERDLGKVARAVSRQRKPLRRADRIGLAAGAVLDRHKMAKHFTLSITDNTFNFTRNTEAVEAESRLDG